LRLGCRSSATAGRGILANAVCPVSRSLLMPQASVARKTPETAAPPKKLTVTLTINGVEQTLAIAPWTTLLDALRDRLGLTGTKKGCDQGQCGACTVLLEGRRIVSCLTLAASVQGRSVTTIEGLATSSGELHPMQQAFIDHHAFPCACCTPG